MHSVKDIGININGILSLYLRDITYFLIILCCGG